MMVSKVSSFCFFRDYIKKPLIISLSIYFVLLVLVFVVWLSWLKFPAEREQELCGALRDKYNNNGSTADILSQMLKLEYEISKEKGMEELIRALHKNFGGMLLYKFETAKHFFNFSADLMASYPNIKIDKIRIISFTHSAISNNGKEIDYLSDVLWDKKQNVLKILRKDADADKIKTGTPEFENWILFWYVNIIFFLVFGIFVLKSYYKKLFRHNDAEVIFEIPQSKFWFFVILTSVFAGLILFISFFAFASLMIFLFVSDGSKRKNTHTKNPDLKILEKNDNFAEAVNINIKEIYGEKLESLRNLKKKQRELREKLNLQESFKIFADFKKESELKALDENINNLRQRLEKMGTELERMQREYFAEIAKKGKLEKEPETVDEDLLREFEKILSLPEVAALEIFEDKIKIYTGTVRKLHGRKIYILGDYIINLGHCNGRFTSANLQIENPVSTHFKNMIHPYVNDKGFFPCLGGATSAIYSLLEQQEIFAAVVNILRILYFYEAPRVNPQYPIEEWTCVEISLEKAKEILEKYKKQKEAANGLLETI